METEEYSFQIVTVLERDYINDLQKSVFHGNRSVFNLVFGIVICLGRIKVFANYLP